VVGKRVEEVRSPSPHELVLARYREAMATRAAVTGKRSPSTLQARVGLVRVVPVVDEGGVATHLVGTVHDVPSSRDRGDALPGAKNGGVS
jgi:hypothetical protein